MNTLILLLILITPDLVVVSDCSTPLQPNSTVVTDGEHTLIIQHGPCSGA